MLDASLPSLRAFHRAKLDNPALLVFLAQLVASEALDESLEDVSGLTAAETALAAAVAIERGLAVRTPRSTLTLTETGRSWAAAQVGPLAILVCS